MNQKKKLLITASTFPRWEGDTEPRFILDYAVAMNRFYDVTVLVPAAVGAGHPGKHPHHCIQFFTVHFRQAGRAGDRCC